MFVEISENKFIKNESLYSIQKHELLYHLCSIDFDELDYLIKEGYLEDKNYDDVWRLKDIILIKDIVVKFFKFIKDKDKSDEENFKDKECFLALVEKIDTCNQLRELLNNFDCGVHSID